MLTRLEERGRLSAPGSLIKGLQGREQATRVKITHTLHRAAGIREPEERGEEIDGEDEEEEEEGEGWSRELGGENGELQGGQRELDAAKNCFFSPFCIFLCGFTRACHSQRERDGTLL